MSDEKREKALKLMSTSTSVKDRSKKYFDSIKRSLWMKKIESLKSAIDDKETEVLELENISLEDNKNKGIKALTKAEIETNFSRIIDLKSEIRLDNIELEDKKSVFEEYFGKYGG